MKEPPLQADPVAKGDERRQHLAKAMTSNDSIYQEITNRIIKRIEDGVVPWQKPWAFDPPRNIISRKTYRGVNVLILGTTEFSSQWWMTFRQARELGGSVKKGSKSEIIVFFKRYEKTDKNGELVYGEDGRQKTAFVLRYSRVFNLEQTEGIKSPERDLPIVKAAIDDGDTDGTIAKAKAIVENARLCPISNGGNIASYILSQDRITMPKASAFKTLAAYFHALFHEMTHATRHPTRLNRKSDSNESYAAEELIAEIGAAFLSNTAGILSEIEFENSAAYIAGWLKALKDDRKLIVHAASAAQKAADFILKPGLTPTAPAEDSQDPAQATLQDFENEKRSKTPL